MFQNVHLFYFLSHKTDLTALLAHSIPKKFDISDYEFVYRIGKILFVNSASRLYKKYVKYLKQKRTRMWANAQRDGRPAEYRWRPLFNAAKFGRRPILDWRAVTLPRRETR